MKYTLSILSALAIAFLSNASQADSINECIERLDLSKDLVLHHENYSEEQHKRNMEMACNLTAIVYGLHSNHINKFDIPEMHVIYDTAIESILKLMNDKHASFTAAEEWPDGEGKAGINVITDSDDSTPYPYVIYLLNEDPSENGGLRVGDIVLTIDEQSTKGMIGMEVVKALLGPRGTMAKLSIQRNGENMEIDVMRKKMPQHSTIKSHVFNIEGKKILYVKIVVFMHNSSQNFINIARSHQDSDGLIMDLRFNPGGVMRDALNTASVLLSDKEVIWSMEAGVMPRAFVSNELTVLPDTVPVVVIVNKKSSSGSELVSVALQENERATIIGETTTGKGSAQEITIFPDTKDKVQFTVAEYFGPDAKKVDGVGITPDIKVSLDMPYNKQAEIIFYEMFEKDLQLARAIDTILEKIDSID